MPYSQCNNLLSPCKILFYTEGTAKQKGWICRMRDSFSKSYKRKIE